MTETHVLAPVEPTEAMCEAGWQKMPDSIADAYRAMLAFAALTPPTGEERPIDMLLFCPKCGAQHIDEPEDGFHEGQDAESGVWDAGWSNPPHRSHLCHACGCIWRPADVPTNGVAAIQTEGNADTWGASNSATLAAPVAGDMVMVEGPSFQARVRPWMMECFGAEIAGDMLERADRYTEECLELVQTIPGFTADRAHALVDYVFSRPVGDRYQEVGGCMVTLAALCLASGLDMHLEGERELGRIDAPDIIAKIRAKQAAKPTGSALPIATPKPVEREPADGLSKAIAHGVASGKILQVREPADGGEGLRERLERLDCVMVDICEPHPGNPSPNIIPVERAKLLAALASPSVDREAVKSIVICGLRDGLQTADEITDAILALIGGAK